MSAKYTSQTLHVTVKIKKKNIFVKDSVGLCIIIELPLQEYLFIIR